MRTVSIPVLLLALTASAAAQSSDSVTVNPMGARVLIDPGTGQERVVPPLLQPWQQDETIRLRPPRKHRARSTDTKTPVASLPETAPPPVRTPRPAAVPRVAVRQPAPQVRPVMPPVATKPAQRTAMIERPNVRASAGTLRDTITFAPNATDPSTSAVSAVRSLAGSLNATLPESGSRVQLLAYGGARGEKSSDTRRLSLKRALVVRQLLIDDGVPSERIDVFALGGVEDDGPTDRVDVYVRS